MNIWIFNPYGNLPGEGWSPYRSTCIAHALTARGHQVVWWVSDFEHRSKRVRPHGTVDFGNGYTARIVPSTRYKAHIGLERVKYERAYAKNLLRAVASTSDRPNAIVHAEPAICFSDISIKVVEACRAPLIIDIIDLWPELFEVVFPRWMRPLARTLMRPLYDKRARFLRKANGFLAVSKDYLQLAQNLAPRTRGQVAYLGTEVAKFSVNTYSRPFPPLHLPQKGPGEIWCIYVGTIGRNYDISTILKAASALKQSNIRVLIAGDGDRRSDVEAANDRNIVNYLGRLSFEQLLGIYPFCDVALACYADGSTVSMPFKAFDYLAAGLPIVTSLRRDLGYFVSESNIGEMYHAGDSHSLVAAILALAKDEARRALSARTARALGARMDYDIQYSNAADFIEEIASESKLTGLPRRCWPP